MSEQLTMLKAINRYVGIAVGIGSLSIALLRHLYQLPDDCKHHQRPISNHQPIKMPLVQHMRPAKNSLAGRS